MDVPAFTIDRYKVTNGEYLKFVDAGGYQERSLWTRGRMGVEISGGDCASVVLVKNGQRLELSRDV